ncbi:unnamed protein product [Ceutorhynchus assimilis]|uniref:Isocitrate dehydrogenase [NAD] subunit, mitochondrial n=1 Tax=Ceutorhynchus assimilis TaxID=467358 RepID=A0A9N9MVS3_9CUCU|nr:unnamed protein product [Ceutorhynchus assimilis]
MSGIITKIFSKIHLQNIQIANTSKIHNKVTATLIPGDGVSPELIHSVQEVFKAAQVPVEWETHLFSEVNHSESLEEVVKSIVKNRVALKGSLIIPDHSDKGDLETFNAKLRKRLDLYANVVHAKSLGGVKSRHKNIDLVIIREQTEGEYSAIEHEAVKGVVECLKIVTAKKSRRIAHFAFDYASRNHRKTVTCIHKANIMKLGDGLFLRSCEAIASLYPDIKFESMIVDSCTMLMVSKPQLFDVLVTPNLYGNIIDNLATGLVGGAGIVSGSTYSSDCVVFEPGAKHAFERAAGKNIANPTAMLLCASKLLRHVNLPEYGEMVRKAVERTIKDGKVLTRDMGGQSGTKEFTKAVIDNLT